MGSAQTWSIKPRSEIPLVHLRLRPENNVICEVNLPTHIPTVYLGYIRPNIEFWYNSHAVEWVYCTNPSFLPAQLHIPFPARYQLNER